MNYFQNKYHILFILLLSQWLIFNNQSKAQYNIGVGLRVGFESGLTIKYFIDDDKAIEGIMSTGTHYGGFLITGLFEIHREWNISGLESGTLNWFYGGGGHIGFFHGTNYYKNKNHKYYGKSVVTIGADVILGVEYEFDEIPITLGLDVKPFFDLVPIGFVFWGGGLSARYVF